MQVAGKMMHHLEEVSDKYHHGYFVDLFVRCDNQVAIDMYDKDGYSVYRRVKGYYESLSADAISTEEDAFGVSSVWLTCSRRLTFPSLHRHEKTAISRYSAKVGPPEWPKYYRVGEECALGAAALHMLKQRNARLRWMRLLEYSASNLILLRCYSFVLSTWSETCWEAGWLGKSRRKKREGHPHPRKTLQVAFEHLRRLRKDPLAGVA